MYTLSYYRCVIIHFMEWPRDVLGESRMGLCEQDLKTLLAANCSAYFYLLVKAYQHRLYGYVLCLLCYHFQDAEDVLQGTFIKVFKALSGYTWLQIEELDLEAWL